MIDQETLGAAIGYINQHGGGGTSNYNQLTNLPSVNGVTLSGNKTASDLGLVAAPIVNLDNGMVSHSTDSEHITVDLDVPLTALKQYSVTLKDPSSNYIETLKVLWNGEVDVIFPGNSYTSGQLKLKMSEETVKLFNYGGSWRDIYCTIKECNEDTSSQKAYGTTVSILTATQQSPYICPSDGVVHIQSNYSTFAYSALYKVGWTGAMAIAKGNGSTSGAMTVPVLKGDALYVATSGTDPIANYYPYVDAE